ncbi:MAG TPA: hypothetical protein P5282_05660 [Anaerolineaceae bacterium]|nr:hypothetical protein [Myxococcota bacterium]HRS74406.1 hypothetical protein [Anaerolineaceae bacterium]HRV17909.1 hypothetical protein [Myxococcota bacterium]
MQIKLEAFSDGSFPSERELRRALDKGIRKAAERARQNFQRGTRTWQDQPDFRIEQLGDADYVVGTDHQAYKFVSGGTRPHRITGNLAFQENYAAKTTPGSMDARSGGPYGPSVYASTVEHPGVEARNFPELNIADLEPRIASIVGDALDDALS